jgi:ribosomal-protein-alanine N-acetyltransferase
MPEYESIYDLRKMQEKDIDAVMGIDRRAGLSPWSRSSFEQELSNPIAEYFVLVKKNKNLQTEVPIGFAGQWYVAGEAQLMKIAVDPEFQGKHLGHFLLEAIIKQARVRGCASMILEVRTDNEPALNLYRSFNFQTIDIREHYYPNGSDAYIMESVFPQQIGDQN